MPIPSALLGHENLTSFYNRIHAPVWGAKAGFMSATMGKPAAKQLFKKYKFLLGLSEEKSRNWILKNFSESNFLNLFESLVFLAEDDGGLEKVDTIVSSVSWNDELNIIQNYTDFACTNYAKQCAIEYNNTGEKLPVAYRDFEKYVLSGASLKDIFYTKVFPKSLHADNSNDFLGYSKEELERIADLRFQNTPEGFEAIKREHASLKELQLETLETPLAHGRQHRKRIMELEFIFCFLMSLKNSDHMQTQLQQTFTKRIADERLSLVDREYTGVIHILYGMFSSEELETTYHGPFSHCYYPPLVLPVLRELETLLS